MMLLHATSFNGDLSKWNTGGAVSMANMFQGATSFNRDLSDWDTGKVKKMQYMFYKSNFDNSDHCPPHQPDVLLTCPV